MKKYFAHETSIIETEDIGEGTKIWHWVHVSPGAKIGKGCILGQNVYIGNNVVIGDNVKIQNNVSVYEGVTIQDDVFLGPSCVFTNDKYPSATGEWELTETIVETGASIGANATIVCGNKIGKGALVGAGSVVTKDVRPSTLVVGNPAKEVKSV
jgi:UDP-2-acetamido-3-amino-2,3-dideoxy-glucuronate N-acetyltransferase